jgi:hypothetical protein
LFDIASVGDTLSKKGGRKGVDAADLHIVFTPIPPEPPVSDLV